jgi:hypothetical protein
VPQGEILTLLHDAFAQAGSDVEALVGRLETVYRGARIDDVDEDARPLTTEQLIALGFLACVKAIRESGLMAEIAVREEIQQIHDLGTELRAALARTETIVTNNSNLIGELQARRWEAARPDSS